MQKLCCVCTRQQFSASLDYFVTSLPPYLHQFSTISGGNCIINHPHGRGSGWPAITDCRRMMSAGSGTITVSVGGAPSHHLPWHAGQPQSMPIPPSRNYTGRRPRPMPCPAPCSVGCWCSKLHSQLLDHLGEQYIACTHCLPEGAMWPSSILNWGALTWTSVSWLLTWQPQVKGERPCVRSSKSW